MAVKRFAGDRFSWLSTDTKPTNVMDGAQGIEVDTGKVWYRYSNTWNEQPVGAGDGLTLASEITTSTTLTSTSVSKYIPVNSVTSVNITIDPNVFSGNTQFVIEQTGAGVVTLIAGSGMTLNGELKTWGQYSHIYVFFKSATVATVIGGSA